MTKKGVRRLTPLVAFHTTLIHSVSLRAASATSEYLMLLIDHNLFAAEYRRKGYIRVQNVAL